VTNADSIDDPETYFLFLQEGTYALKFIIKIVRPPVLTSLLQVVQTGSGVHPTSYPMGTGGSFLGGKAAGA
jgi:hypothetical protein